MLTIVKVRRGLADERAVRKERQGLLHDTIESATREDEEIDVLERPPAGTR